MQAKQEESLGDWYYTELGWYQYNVEHRTNKYSAYGYELQLLNSILINKHFTLTIIGRTNVSHYKEDYRNDKGGRCTIHNSGVRANMMMSFGKVFFIPEFGVEYVPVAHGENTWCPAMSMGLGLRL
ncbi:MAG: hypothetical protein PHY48_03910 [Candidatus Cloacimonetes bacterium]|nr:hypothetical protein [Candidatus Cloacimonadota bacterium]